MMKPKKSQRTSINGNVGDYYGTGVRNPEGKLVYSYLEAAPSGNGKLKKPLKKIA